MILALAFIAGVASFFTPCTFYVLPYLLTYSSSTDRGAKQGAFTGLGFVVGLSATYASIGYASAAILSSLGLSPVHLNLAIGILLVVLGLALLASSYRLTCKVPHRALWVSRHKGLLGGLALGSIIGLTYTPCATPLMAGVLLASLKAGALMTSASLFIYGLGLGLPSILLATVLAHLKSKLEGKGKVLIYVERASGFALAALGLLKLAGLL